MMCCYVIVTLRSLLWALLSILVFLAELASMMSAHWLIGKPKLQSETDSQNNTSNSIDKETYRTTGLFLRCEQKEPITVMSVSDHCRVYAHSISEIASPCWIATSFFMAFAILILLLVGISSIFALCFRNVGRKSIFSICGILQAISGLFLILALVLFPAGWGADKVQAECGGDSAPFYPGTCQIGWAYYAAILGTFMAFLCAVLSNQAESATGSERIERKIDKGKNPVFAL